MSGALLKLLPGDRQWGGRGESAASDLNPWLRMLSGLGEGMIKVRGGGDVFDHVDGTVSSAGNYQAQFQSTAGKHLAIRLAATGGSVAPTAANSVLLVDDAGLFVGNGAVLRIYETGGTDYAQLASSNGLLTLGGSGASAGSMTMSGVMTALDVVATQDVTAGRDLTTVRNLLLVGVGPRIVGDFSNATHASRVLAQTSVVNGNTSVGAIANGTGTFGGFTAYGGSNPAAAAFVQLAAVGGTDVRITSSHIGAAYLPLVIYQNGALQAQFPAAGGFEVTAIDPPASNLQVTAGSQCKAFGHVTAGGGATLEDSYNVTSVARNGSGDFTVTIDRNFTNATYATVATVRDNGADLIWRVDSQAAGSFDLHFRDLTGALTDPDAFGFACFGTLS